MNERLESPAAEVMINKTCPGQEQHVFVRWDEVLNPRKQNPVVEKNFYFNTTVAISKVSYTSAANEVLDYKNAF